MVSEEFLLAKRERIDHVHIFIAIQRSRGSIYSSENDSLDGDNDSDQSKEDKRGHQRRQSHENILAFRPNSLTGLTIKTPAPVPDGREHDRPDDKRKGLGGLKIKTGNKKTTSATPKAASVASPVAEGNKRNTLEQLDTLDDDELDDDELDDGETDDDDEDLESEVSGFSQLSEAQQQKMNKFKEQQMKAKSKKKNNRGSNTSSGTTERSADEKHNEEEEEPKTPRNHAKGRRSDATEKKKRKKKKKETKKKRGQKRGSKKRCSKTERRLSVARARRRRRRKRRRRKKKDLLRKRDTHAPCRRRNRSPISCNINTYVVPFPHISFLFFSLFFFSSSSSEKSDQLCRHFLFCLDTSGVERESAEGRERHNNSPLCGGRDESEHVHAGDDAAGAKDDGKHDAATDAADAADGVENGHGRPGMPKMPPGAAEAMKNMTPDQMKQAAEQMKNMTPDQ